VVHVESHGIVTATEVGTLGKDAVVQMALGADVPAAQAVLVPDTAMRSLAWLEDMENALGKPVLTANQVTVWEGLRIAGWTGSLPGMGKLFAAGRARG